MEKAGIRDLLPKRLGSDRSLPATMLPHPLASPNVRHHVTCRLCRNYQYSGLWYSRPRATGYQARLTRPGSSKLWIDYQGDQMKYFIVRVRRFPDTTEASFFLRPAFLCEYLQTLRPSNINVGHTGYKRRQ